ncbi:MAG: hypothetical protein ACE5G1_02695 [bacterium]
MDKEHIFDLLTQPGERLTFLMQWLKSKMWSLENFNQLPPETYMEQGEKAVYEVEELIANATWGLYDEIVAASTKAQNLAKALSSDNPISVVIFDGASVRELPLFEKLARETGFEILISGYGFAALPSDTDFFIEQRLLEKRLAPSQLPIRKELKEKGVRTFYYDSPTRNFELTSSDDNLLLWSHFPDGTYKDLSARFSSHFGEMLKLYGTVWKNIVMQIPKEHEIIITSDHGYIFLGPGLESTTAGEAAKTLNQNRYRFFADDEPLPEEVPGLHVIGEKRLAMLQGRIKNRPQGPSGNKAYRHGGLSLMEMLTPWLEIKRK